MDGTERPPLSLSREDLYELAWSKPISELAKDFGISDVALAKRCRRLGSPVPRRGYWAHIDAGQQPYRPKLPEREEQWHDRSALAVHCLPPEKDEGLKARAANPTMTSGWRNGWPLSSAPRTRLWLNSTRRGLGIDASNCFQEHEVFAAGGCGIFRRLI